LDLRPNSSTPPKMYFKPPPPPSDNPADYDAALWANWFKLWLGRMPPGDFAEFSEQAHIQREAGDIKRIEGWRDWCFQYSPTVIFLRKQIQALNGDLNAENVICKRCPARRDEKGRIIGSMSGGFSPEGGILVCANQIMDRKHLEDTLAHEMVHAWDQLRWKVDWDNLRHAACTEIRASTLSGECRWTKEFFTRNQFKLTQQHQNCVRARAVQSMMNRPACKDDVQAAKVVNEVWDSCYKDTRPFDEIYR
ncbi:Mitochondrial inner membrane protease atp23, partial [Lachnellula cervina]